MCALLSWCSLLLTLVTSVAAYPTNYTRIDELGFYRAFVKPAQWVDALRACSRDKGSLVEVSTEAEALTVGRVLRDVGVNTPAFVGFHNNFNEGVYHYISGSRISKELLSLLAANNSAETLSRCGAVDANGMISMQECAVARPFVCKTRLWRGYEYEQGQGYYLLSQEAVSWEEARDYCERDGAHLVVINSPSEASTLTRMMQRHPYSPESSNSSLAAIGVHDQFREGFYITVKGHQLVETGFSEWAHGEPDNGDLQQDEHCVFLHRESSRLVDGRCGDRHVFICEREMPARGYILPNPSSPFLSDDYYF